MRAAGGYATLGELYKTALKIPGVEWKTNTPFKSINRIVQIRDTSFEFVQASGPCRSSKTNHAYLTQEPKRESDHTYYQGLLVELGILGNKRHSCRNRTAESPFWVEP